MPEAVSYEALINVFVTLRRTDLIPVYMDRFQSSGVHMTAYIANLLIKGYAVAGELEKARGVFANLADPPTGVAAPNNHAPHELDATAPVHPHAPVYREVSRFTRESPVLTLLTRWYSSHQPGKLWFERNLVMGIATRLSRS